MYIFYADDTFEKPEPSKPVYLNTIQTKQLFPPLTVNRRTTMCALSAW